MIMSSTTPPTAPPTAAPTGGVELAGPDDGVEDWLDKVEGWLDVVLATDVGGV